jgi:hypothetical protein
MTDLLSTARSESAKAFDELYKTQVPLASQGMNMTAEERAHLRKIITSNPAWPAYRQEWAIDASSLDKRRVLHFCETRGIDWHGALVAFHEAEDKLAIDAGETADEREARIARQIRQDELDRATKAAREADKARNQAWQDRVAADKAAEDAAQRATAAAIASTVIPTPPAAKPASAAPHATQSAVPTFGGDGTGIVQTIAGALWAPMLDAIKADMDATIAKAIGEIPTAIITVQRADGSKHTLPSTHHPLLPTLIKICGSRMKSGFPPNVWLAGPTGSGKSHAAKQVAEAMGLDFHVQGAMSQAFELLGFIDAGGTYHTTPFRRAFEHGGLVLLDEIDAGSNEAMLAVNGATANGGASFPDGYIARHPDCVILGAANTWGSGPTAEFVGRARIDTAILSRFPAKLAWTYDTALEIRISGNEKWTRRVQDARARCQTHKIKHLIDPRHSQAGAAMIEAGMLPDDVAKLTYLAGLSDEDARKVEGRAF